jgi:hypothetical protein
MNIFALDRDPFQAAQMHCDRHVIKMIVEYAQLLSTAHRQLDGSPHELLWTDKIHNTADGSHKIIACKKTLLVLEGETPYVETEHVQHQFNGVTYTDTIGSVSIFNRFCYNSTHHNHPCAIWARQSDANYHWLAMLFEGVLREYTHRYKKIHATERLLGFLRGAPKNLPHGPLTPFALAMPDEYKTDDEIISYQNYYVGDKARFARWTNSPVPRWFLQGVVLDESHFSRTRSVL